MYKRQGLVAASLAGCSSKKADTPADTQAAGTQAAGSEAAGSEAATEAAKANTDFPKKNIKIIVPYDAVGGVDITTRILTEAAGKDYFNGHSLIVENMAGGGAVIGQTAVCLLYTSRCV